MQTVSSPYADFNMNNEIRYCICGFLWQLVRMNSMVPEPESQSIINQTVTADWRRFGVTGDRDPG